MVVILGSCGRPKEQGKDKTGQEAQQVATPMVAEKPVEKKPLQLPPLSEYDITTFNGSLLLVQGRDGRSRPGVVIHSSTQNNYSIVCTLPPEDDSAIALATTRSDRAMGSAKRSGLASQGLSIFTVNLPSMLAPRKPSTSNLAKGYHVLKLSPGPELTDEERKQLEDRLLAESTSLDEARAKRNQRQRTPPGRQTRMPSYGTYPSPDQSGYEMTEPRILQRIETLKKQLLFGRNSYVMEEIASAPLLEDLETVGVELADTILATSNKELIAIRNENGWINLDEWKKSLPTVPQSVRLSVSGGNTTLNLQCELRWLLAPESSELQLIAATTHNLESAGSGSAEERLSQIQGIKFSTNRGAVSNAYHNLQWAGTPTTLYLRIINANDPAAVPLIDERIAISYSGGFSAKWEKPPSPLIELPTPEPNTPEDLIRESMPIPLAGKIVDIVPSMGGDSLMVRTDLPPYWVSLDLKTGKSEESTWRAGPDTLLADWGGKVCLIDRKQRIVQIWNGRQRESIRLLDVNGEITSVAAPIASSSHPMVVLTTEELVFLGPDFKRLNFGEDLTLQPVENGRQPKHLQLMQPGTMWVRASADGALYTVTGYPKSGNNMPQTISMQLNGNGNLKFQFSSEMVIIPTRLRQLMSSQGNTLPDHAGSRLTVKWMPANGPFPKSLPKLVFQETENRREIAAMQNAAAFPAGIANDTTDGLARDRQMYFDSKLQVLVIPNGSTLHFHRLNIPQQPMILPKFAFTGETIRFKAEPGSGHKVSSNPEGKWRVEGGEIVWTAPDMRDSNQSLSLKIEWTGELGSLMSKNYPLTIYSTPSLPCLLPEDGSAPVPLKLRSVLPSQGITIIAYAGGGHVLVTGDNETISVWSLVDGGLLWKTKIAKQIVCGDLDHLYVMDRSGWLHAYNLMTGEEIAKRQVASFGRSGRNLTYFSTGHSSRDPLLGYLQEDMKKYICSIDRKTLDISLIDIDPNALSMLNSELRPNPAGSVFANFGGIILRDRNSITLNRPNFSYHSSKPDASGRYLIEDGSSCEIFDMDQKPPVNIAGQVLGPHDSKTKVQTDVSGRFLVVTFSAEESQKVITLHRIGADFPKIARLSYHHNGSREPVVIGATNTFLMQIGDYSGPLGIYELDLPKEADR